MILALALLPLALARGHGAATTLYIPVAPPPGPGPSHNAAFVPLPKGASPADPWTSDFPAITCHQQGDAIAVDGAWDPANWPYSLPAAVTCSQGSVRVTVSLAFTAPDPAIWTASDGTLVVPRRAGAWQSWSRPLPGIVVASAKLVPEVPGVSCSGVEGMLHLDITGEAQPGSATCEIVDASGKEITQRVVLVAY